jgi:hypothetical protein
VDVAAAPVLSYADEVFSGKRKYLLPTPIIPGCGAIGRVRALGPDATKLKIGDWVFCDPTVRSRDDALMPDIVLQGWSGRGQGGMKIQQYFRDGPFSILCTTSCKSERTRASPVSPSRRSRSSAPIAANVSNDELRACNCCMKVSTLITSL